MQFQVPQFLDVEDKIIGPFTIKQFLYMAGGIGLGYLSFRLIPWTIISLIPAFGFVALGGALAFYKYNNKPFVFLIESAFNYLKSERLYIWKRQKKEQTTEITLDLSNFKPTKHTGNMPMVNTGSKLNDLTWAIDVEGKKDVQMQKVHGESV